MSARFSLAHVDKLISAGSMYNEIVEGIRRFQSIEPGSYLSPRDLYDFYVSIAERGALARILGDGYAWECGGHSTPSQDAEYYRNMYNRGLTALEIQSAYVILKSKMRGYEEHESVLGSWAADTVLAKCSYKNARRTLVECLSSWPDF